MLQEPSRTPGITADLMELGEGGGSNQMRSSSEGSSLGTDRFYMLIGKDSGRVLEPNIQILKGL